jgi:SRSO17 transposase
MTPADLRRALPLFDRFIERFAPLFGDDSRIERAKSFLRGLVLDSDSNKNAETIALNVYQDPSQVRMVQFFIGQASWKDAPLRDELARWVDEELGSEDGLFVLDESSFAKCGDKSVGVARQYCGSTGKLDNGQVAVYLSYASDKGHTLLDTWLYLPREWTDDRERCRQAGVPETVVFRTKPELALELLTHLRHQVRHGWTTFDEGYGKDPAFLSGLEELGERYIGEVPKNVRGWLKRPVVEEAAGRRKKARVRADQAKPQTLEEIVAALPSTAWQRLAYREGTKGAQHAHFARLRFFMERDDLPGPEQWLMVERSTAQEPVIKYYLCNAEETCPSKDMVAAGHSRWTVEDCFLQGKQEVGMDAYEVRCWRGWHHHMTMVMLALWFLKLETRRLGEKSGPRDHVA